MPTDLEDALDPGIVSMMENWAVGQSEYRYIHAVIKAARRVANAQKAMTPHHQQDLNDDLRRAIGRGKFSPFEGDIERLLNVCDALLTEEDADG